jgi:hypothetical protein
MAISAGRDRDRGEADEPEDRRDERIELRRGEERQRADADPDTDGHEGGRAVAPLEQPGADREGDPTADQPDEDARLGADPASAECEAEEEDRPDDQRDPAGPREETGGELLVEGRVTPARR